MWKQAEQTIDWCKTLAEGVWFELGENKALKTMLYRIIEAGFLKDCEFNEDYSKFRKLIWF